jgi:hypothetical protein
MRRIPFVSILVLALTIPASGASGVVLRGSGAGDNGTILKMTGDPHVAVGQVSPRTLPNREIRPPMNLW